MKINKEIYDISQKNNGIITTAQVESLGYSRMLLITYMKEGLIERVRHGVYILTGKVEDDMYTIMLSSKKIVFSHETALFLNGISERTPFIHSLTIPSNTSLPSLLKDECKCYYIKPELYNIGLSEAKTTFGNTVRCYDKERTICDLLRSRNRCDEETVISAIKNYVLLKEKNLNLLAEYAEKFKVYGILKRYLEVLL